ncbi:homoserine acetyltransferase [Escherichia coli]|nr:homoserine acetyltransferase [Escherichia coli]EFU7136464.1 homoserine acetyltransferase [Escherichia coli]HAN9209825.1 homoserine acetyltransferase [Escherichia coli]HBA5072453.1 homoserine acetyltransferase [Escherichia coli]
MGKGSSKGHTPREAKDNLKSTQLLSVIDAISEGGRLKVRWMD